jgi:hypothetical protein
MTQTSRILAIATVLLAQLGLASHLMARDVIAFWGFEDSYDFATNPNKQDFLADAGTQAGTANLQAYLGNAGNLDNDGGTGSVSYTSPTSGLTYDETFTLKFNDLAGGGNDFDIGGVTSFQVDKNDGAGPLADDFGNDALVYITLDGTGYEDFEIRFDIEATPASLPTTFDIFFRTGATGGVWYRKTVQNNIALTFVDYSTPDPENKHANSGVISLSSILNGASPIEIILNDFSENGNDEMELDNIEITANRTVPEPGSLVLLAVAALSVAGRRR